LTEAARKIARVREILPAGSALRLRGVDWFAWITAGAYSPVILTSETGIAEALITSERALILTNDIERERLAEEEIRGREFEIVTSKWNDPTALNRVVAEFGLKTYSDRPGPGEHALPRELQLERLILWPEEIERYEALSAAAALAMSEALSAAEPGWTEERLAGEGARALWSRGIDPTLVLVAGERRLEKHRHPVAKNVPLEGRAMMVFCARKFGLYANFTRFVSFRTPTAQEEDRFARVSEVEDAAFKASKPGAGLQDVFFSVRDAYARLGMLDEIEKQHIGGLTGYLSREAFARPLAPGEIDWPIALNSALAWNPTMAGTKMEDTVLVTGEGVRVLTRDPAWPVETRFGGSRPAVLVKT
jgi:hypothetical protein